MRRNLAKTLVLVGVVLTVAGAGVCGACDPKLIVVWTDIEPPDGSSIASATTDIVVTGSEEKHLSVNYSLTFWLERENPGGSWSYAGSPASRVMSGWSVGVPGCSEIQTNTLTFEDVDLYLGTNTFRVRTHVTWNDSEDKALLDEEPFTYTRTE